MAYLQVGDDTDAAPEAQHQDPRLLHAVHHRRQRRRPGRQAEHDDVGLNVINIDHHAGQPADTCACGITLSPDYDGLGRWSRGHLEGRAMTCPI